MGIKNTIQIELFMKLMSVVVFRVVIQNAITEKKVILSTQI